jgi:Tfp pilus assembly protein PilP
MRARLALALVAMVVPLAGCGNSAAPPGSTPPPAPASLPTAAAPAKPATSTVQTAAATTLEPAATAKYDAKGRRDPFAALDTVEGTKSATVAAAKLRGLVRGGSGMLALVDTAEGVGYILKQGDTLADGRVVEIGQDSVVFAVAAKAGTATNRIVLRLPTE